MRFQFDNSRVFMDLCMGIGIAAAMAVVLLFLLFILTPIAISICDRVQPSKRPRTFAVGLGLVLAPFMFLVWGVPGHVQVMGASSTSVDAYALGLDGWLTIGGGAIFDGNAMLLSAVVTVILLLIAVAVQVVIVPTLVPEDHLCSRCGYELQGLRPGTTRCPECGAPLPLPRRGLLIGSN